MRAQFSFEFVIDVALALVVIGFLIAFFTSISSNNSDAGEMNGVCTLVANSINSVTEAGGLSTVVYLPLQNFTVYQNYTINVSKGVIIVYNYANKKIPSRFLAGQNIVSCGASTTATQNESFEPSDLALYQYNNSVSIAYVYANYTSNFYPYFVYVGGFPQNATLYLQYPNSTLLKLDDGMTPYIYDAYLYLPTLPAGAYTLVAKSDNNTAIMASQSFSVA